MKNPFKKLTDNIKENHGSRFQASHKQLAKYSRKNLFLRIGLFIFGTLCLLSGIVLLFFPGPGLLVILIGLMLIAGSSLSLAIFLDRLEVAIIQWLKRLKKKPPQA